MGADTMIEFNNISKFFGSVIALKDVTMHVKKGEIMCLLGDNGAGKSTLIKTLSGVHKPDEGEIIVEGRSEDVVQGKSVDLGGRRIIKKKKQTTETYDLIVEK